MGYDPAYGPGLKRAIQKEVETTLARDPQGKVRDGQTVVWIRIIMSAGTSALMLEGCCISAG